jgi:tRNA-Thr(GGU) m(6)t(6)A37 methyltransferase TsaA
VCSSAGKIREEGAPKAFMKTIARIRTDFPEKFGIPRQSGLVEALEGTIIFEPEYRNPEIVRGLEEFSHIWLLWQFSQSNKENWSATVKPPRLGGRKRLGVFATRSPYRPNDIGLSCVKLKRIEMDKTFGPIIHVSGADLLDGTPLYDIKPYIPLTDCHPEAAEGYTRETKAHRLKVVFPEELLNRYPHHKREAVIGVLAQDPRPAYVQDPERIYGVAFAGFDVRFQVEGDWLTVKDVIPLVPHRNQGMKIHEK